jgi:hypothetical protein
VIGVDKTGTIKVEVEDIADVLGIVRRARLRHRGQALITHNKAWCAVDWRTMVSTAVKGVHVLGDATLSAPLMPKSASMANQHAKICASAVVALLNGRQPNPDPTIVNTCYSFVSDSEVIHVTSVHTWDEKDKTLKTVPGSGGVSAARSELEGKYGWAWAQNIWQDALG